MGPLAHRPAEGEERDGQEDAAAGDPHDQAAELLVAGLGQPPGVGRQHVRRVEQPRASG